MSLDIEKALGDPNFPALTFQLALVAQEPRQRGPALMGAVWDRATPYAARLLRSPSKRCWALIISEADASGEGGDPLLHWTRNPIRFCSFQF
jgi:hypothetical protein